MIFNDHSKLEGLHAFLGASKYHWINWDDITFEERFYSQYDTVIGTALHELAKNCINSRTKLTKQDKNLIIQTLYVAGVPRSAYNPNLLLSNLLPYVNDSIGFHMKPEVILYHSKYCFGTTDAIRYFEKEKVLMINDYKSGRTPAKIEQLKIYAALFCLEYHIDPYILKEIKLRIYQNCMVLEDMPTSQEIDKYMQLIKDRSEFARRLYERDANE